MENSSNFLKQKISPFILVFLTIIFLGVILFFLSQYHIVIGTEEILIKRPYYGFSDIIGDVRECSDVPYILAMVQHPSLCQALGEAGYFSPDFLIPNLLFPNL